jgi:N-acetylneuraminate synthase
MSHITINGRRIGADGPCHLIAEAADAHHGSLDMAIAMVDMAMWAGADAIKFQHHLPDEEMLRDLPASSNMAEPLYEFIKRNCLTLEQHKKLAAYCLDSPIQYLCTPFSWAAAQEINPLVPAFKIGSGEGQDFPFLRRVAGLGKPMIVSTGMCDWDEVADLVDTLDDAGAQYALMHCVSEYPPAYDDLNIDCITQMRSFGVPIGYSDHTPDIHTSLAAVTLGASLVEKHITLSPHIAGPDASVSITADQLRRLAEGLDQIRRSRGMCKEVHSLERPIRDWAFRSIIFTQDLPAGTVLTQDHLWSKRPGTGILSKRMPEFIGKTLAVAVTKDTMLKETMCV